MRFMRPATNSPPPIASLLLRGNTRLDRRVGASVPRSVAPLAALVFLVASSGCASPPVASAPRPWARDPGGLASLRSVVEGSWEGATDEGRKAQVDYHAISSGSAVAETFGARPRSTMTLFHADHGELVATHYCAQGNQPRLRAVAIAPRRFRFVVESVTDLDPGEAHLVELELAAEGETLERVEVYRDPTGHLERTHFRFVRTGT